MKKAAEGIAQLRKLNRRLQLWFWLKLISLCISTIFLWLVFYHPIFVVLAGLCFLVVYYVDEIIFKKTQRELIPVYIWYESALSAGVSMEYLRIMVLEIFLLKKDNL
jgi:hypothetical protein